MFEQISQSSVDLKKHQLLHLSHSLNQPQISPGQGLGAQAAEAYLMVVQDTNRSVSIYVGLFFAQSDLRILYRRGPTQVEVLDAEMSKAEIFTSEMGFLMSNLNYAAASSEEKKEIERTVPFFYREIEHYYQSLSISEIEAKRVSSESTVKKDMEADLHQIFLQQYVTMLGML